MKILDLQQGSPEWLAHRRGTHNASDASVMMGASPNATRAALLRAVAGGIEREFSEYVQSRILDRGHEVEPALRARAEEFIGEDLYPVTATSDDGYLGASFDGVTLSGEDIFEGKQWSEAKAACMADGIIPPADYWQIVQQFAVCDTALNCHYFVGDGSDERTVMLVITREQVERDVPKLRAGWAQFDADVAAFVPGPDALPPPTGKSPDHLPALRVDLKGMVTFSNLAEFKAGAMQVLGAINRDLQTDEDFADAEQTVKWAKGVEERLEAVKAQALSQTADIEAVFRTIDEVSAETRRVRLDLDKLVKARKDAVRGEIVAAGVAAVRAHFDTINSTMGEHRFSPAQSLSLDIGAAIKGKKSISSMRDAVDAAVAVEKIEASQRAERIRACAAILAEHPDHASLFADRVLLCASKAPDDLRNLIAARIAEFDRREAARLEAERERIRQEEVARIERERQQAEDSAAKAAQQDTAPAAVVSTPAPAPAPTTPAAAVRPGATIKLGDINARIAPLSITADGIAQLGYRPSGSAGSAKLYPEGDFPGICRALQRVLDKAIEAKAAA
jgi:predicted phage-related endonuclease